MPTPVPLSVVIITKNEEDRIEGCLESVRWAAELIVVDDGSTDRTVEIARRYTDRVIQRRMEVEGIHRNHAYGLASHEWILSLDADERVTPELRTEIAALLAARPPLNGYAIPRRNYLGHRWLRHGGFYPSPQLRLFRQGHFKYEEVEVHPRAFLDTEAGCLQGDLIHHSYRNIEDFVAKLNRQTTLEATKWRNDGRSLGVGKGLWRTVDRFARTYWGKQGYRDGLLGFIMAVLGGVYQFLSFAKYWVAQQSTRAIPCFGGDPSQHRSRRPSEAWARSMLGLARPSWRSGHPARSACARAARVTPFAGTPGAARPRQTISAVILTKNEAHLIRRCLEAIRWVDEIIVVDGESTDGTPEICREYGATVVTHRFEGDFGQERNIGNAHATKDWILQLDADDLATEGFRRAAEEVLRNESPHAAYRFRRTNCFLGHWMRYGGWDHYSLHFFRRGKARYQGRVHHALLVDGSIGTLEATIEHYPFTSLEQFVDRQNRYTSLEALELMAQRSAVSEHELRYQLMVRPIKLFWKLYVKKQGFRDGMHGLVFAGLYSFVHFLKWAKYWELSDGRPRDLPRS